MVTEERFTEGQPKKLWLVVARYHKAAARKAHVCEFCCPGW